MSRTKPEGNRKIKVREHPHDDLFECIGLLGSLNAIDHLAEDNAANLVKLAGIFKLHEHAIDLIWLRGDIFKKEDSVFRLDLVRGSQRCNQHRKAATIELPFGSSLLKSQESRGLR